MNHDDHRFLGRGWAFPPQFDGGQVEMVEAERDIEQSLHVLLATSQGERLMRPTFGFGLQEHVFDLMDDSALTEMAYWIEEAVRMNEPRIELERVDLKPHPDLEGRLDIAVAYTVIATNNRANVVFPFYVKEGTSVRAL